MLVCTYLLLCLLPVHLHIRIHLKIQVRVPHLIAHVHLALHVTIRSYMITPNQFEAELLVQKQISSEADTLSAMKELLSLGPKVPK